MPQSYLLVYTGQGGADEVEHAAMTQSSACLLIGTGLGLRTTIILRCERLPWTVPQADQAALSKACRASSSITGTRHPGPLIGFQAELKEA